MSGVVALVGGGEFTPACTFDADLLTVSGAEEVLVLPTAAAFEHPERAVTRAAEWFGSLGARARGLPVLARSDAAREENVEAVRASRFTYLTGGSPMHLRSVLKASPLWDALVEAHESGGVVAASGAGAMVLSDPMVDVRGGAFTIGLGLVPRMAVLPSADRWSADHLRRTLDLGHGFTILAIDTGSAAIRWSDGRWEARGRVAVYVDGKLADLAAIPG